MSVFQFPFFVVTLVAAVICLQYGQAHNTHRLNNDAKHHDKRDVWYGDFGFDLEPVEQVSLPKSCQSEPSSGRPFVTFLYE